MTRHVPLRIPRGARWLKDQLMSWPQDQLMGVTTTWPRPRGVNDPTRPSPYEAASYTLLRHLGQKLAMGSHDVFFDIGCGAGRALCFFARQGVQGVGIEYDAALAGIAQRNVHSLRQPHAPAKVMCADATTVDYGDATVLYLFNPFSAAVLQSFLDKVRSTHRCRDLRLVYLVPAHRDVLVKDGSFELYDESAGRHLGFTFPIEFWRWKDR